MRRILVAIDLMVISKIKYVKFDDRARTSISCQSHHNMKFQDISGFQTYTVSLLGEDIQQVCSKNNP